jgi:hypothetical protein
MQIISEGQFSIPLKDRFVYMCNNIDECEIDDEGAIELSKGKWVYLR